MSFGDDNEQLERMEDEIQRSVKESSSESENESMDMRPIDEGELINEIDMSEREEKTKN